MRYEIKYLLDANQVTEIESWLAGKPFVRRTFAQRQVNSVYFDSATLGAARDNLIGAAYRKKFRVRWYGEIGESQKALRLEVKSKEGRLGNKVSAPLNEISMPLMDMNARAMETVVHGDPAMRTLIPQGTALIPIIYVGYKRRYHEGADGVRITFDEALSFSDIWRNRHLSIDPMAKYQKSVLEFKFSPRVKDQAARMMRDLRLTPVRSSKYVIGLSMLGRANYL